MSRVFVQGWGVVSPAGWGVSPFLGALAHRVPLPIAQVARPDGKTRRLRRVPPLGLRPAWLAQPRLRRSSAITHFAISAGLEALVPRDGQPSGGSGAVGGGASSGTLLDRARVGVVCAVMGGGVIYSRRFYEEVRQNPQFASPLLFPETVFNAPASHLSALLGSAAPNDTLVGDQTGFISGLVIAADWLQRGTVDACLVVGAEEADWLTAEAAQCFPGRAPVAEGAGALLLSRNPGPVELLAISEPEPFFRGRSRSAATAAVRTQLAGWEPAVEYDEGDVQGIFGDGLAAVGAWAAVAAVTAIAVAPEAETEAVPRTVERAAALVTGANFQAHGVVFGRPYLPLDP